MADLPAVQRSGSKESMRSSAYRLAAGFSAWLGVSGTVAQLTGLTIFGVSIVIDARRLKRVDGA